MYSIPTMSSGMVRIVHPPAHAISSTTLHAWFTKNLPTPTTDDIGLRICVGSVLEKQPLYCGYSYGSYALVGIN